MQNKSVILGAMLFAALVLLTACLPQEAQPDNLTIPLTELSDTPRFYDWDSGGTVMQVIARLDSSGEPRLAYNTCQVCLGSPYAYFELTQGWLVCQNCGNAFPPDSVGKVSGGCNPKPLTKYDVSAESVTVSAEDLASAAPMFKNWKAFK